MEFLARIFAGVCIIAIVILARAPSAPVEPGHVHELAACNFLVKALCDDLGSVGSAVTSADAGYR